MTAPAKGVTDKVPGFESQRLRRAVIPPGSKAPDELNQGPENRSPNGAYRLASQ